MAKVKQPTKTIFCAGEQKETAHVLSIAANGELMATCPCGQFLKFPHGISPEEFNEQVQKHKADNEGQVSIEALEASLKEFAD